VYDVAVENLPFGLPLVRNFACYSSILVAACLALFADYSSAKIVIIANLYELTPVRPLVQHLPTSFLAAGVFAKATY
jgi:hypothetical protein